MLCSSWTSRPEPMLLLCFAGAGAGAGCWCCAADLKLTIISVAPLVHHVYLGRGSFVFMLRHRRNSDAGIETMMSTGIIMVSVHDAAAVAVSKDTENCNTKCHHRRHRRPSKSTSNIKYMIVGSREITLPFFLLLRKINLKSTNNQYQSIKNLPTFLLFYEYDILFVYVPCTWYNTIMDKKVRIVLH